jgi:hypothetical protein
MAAQAGDLALDVGIPITLGQAGPDQHADADDDQQNDQGGDVWGWRWRGGAGRS